MNQTKRIVIIEGDAFDADAVIAITKADIKSFKVMIESEIYVPVVYGFSDERTRNHAMAVAVDAWRGAVGDLTVPHPEPLPFPPVIEPDELSIIRHWSDEKGRYYETYGGSTIYFDPALGNFIWNEGPPRRKNPLGPEASPIVKIYVGSDGKPLSPQPA